MVDPALVIRPVGPENFADLAALFEARGGPHTCWCTAWRAIPVQATIGTPDARKAVRKALVQAAVDKGVSIGLLAYRDAGAVGGCAIGPRDSLRSISGTWPAADAGQGPVWTITCFFVPRALRGQGIAAALLGAAISHARNQGAGLLEASPVDPTSPSFRFMGFVPQFLAAGFSPVGPVGARRHLMTLAL